MVYLHVEKETVGLCHSTVLIIHPLWREQVDRQSFLFRLYFVQKNCFLESHSSMYDNLYLHGFEDSEAVSGGASDTCKPCFSVVSWLDDPYANTYRMR